MFQPVLRVLQHPRFRAASSTRLLSHLTIINPSEPIEEETLPNYHRELYYPVSIGQIIHCRYKVLTKLGFGSESTVWLAQDTTKWRFQRDRFVTLKICIANKENDLACSREVKLAEVIAYSDPRHEGLCYLRTSLDSFTIPGQCGSHLCLTYTPMRENLTTFQRRLRDGKIPPGLLKPLLKFLLLGLDYLHTKCHIIHTDLKPDNILLGIEDDRILHDLIEQEQNSPSPAKILSDRRIYPHRNFGDFQTAPGRPKIGDFGLAVQNGRELHYHPIQPDCLQAPEVILCAGWSYSADIWNLGVMLWDLLEGRPLFHAQDSITKLYAPEIHLSEMITMLGPPPKCLLQRGRSTGQYFTPSGGLINENTSPTFDCGFENSVSALSGNDKQEFLRLVKRMLRWLPEDRATAEELLSDAWFKS